MSPSTHREVSVSGCCRVVYDNCVDNERILWSAVVYKIVLARNSPFTSDLGSFKVHTLMFSKKDLFKMGFSQDSDTHVNGQITPNCLGNLDRVTLVVVCESGHK